MASKKALAIEKVNEHLGYKLLESSNTSFASVNNAKPVWWLDINPKKFQKELHLLLAMDQRLIWLRLKANTFPIPKEKFSYRSGNGYISLEISCNNADRYLYDIRSGGTGYDFSPHVELDLVIF